VLTWLLGLAPQPEIRGHLLRDEGEVIVDEVAHHWVAYVRSVIYAVLGLLLVAAVLVVDLDIGWLFLVGGGAALLWAAHVALDVHMDRFVVTNMRVFRVHGVLSQSLATMPLSRILDITVDKPFVGRILGYGHFTFESAAQAQGLREITTVARPDERDLTIQRVVQRAGLRGPRVN
jgi:membrane protein YdbS with pleckstrin-like domain